MAVTSSDFWDRIAPGYSKQPITDNETHARKLAATQALIQPSMAVVPVLQWLGKAPYVSFLRAEDMRREAASAGFEPQEHWTHGRTNTLFLVARKLDLP